jgi:hypothetical protein
MANALLVVMVLGGLLCLFVMSYLSLVEEQNRLSARSQAWNIAIAVSEAGIEEGLEVLNSASLPQASDGWTANGKVYSRTNTLPGGNAYGVSLDLTLANAPAIVARSYINLPFFAAAPSQTMFALIGPNGSGSTIVSRAVRVTCSKNPSSLFTAAMVAKHAIALKGDGVLTDSFDSSNPAKSTNGKYDGNKYKGDRGDVATNDGIIVGVGNANIYGKLHTGPNGSYNMGPNGGVGTHAWQTQYGSGLEPDYFLQDANFTFPNTSLPDASGYLKPQPGDVVTTTHPVTSNLTTSATCPEPLPWGGVVTNITAYITNSACPSPAPANLITKTNWVNASSTLPSPIPYGTTTNWHHVHNYDLPAQGTYMPGTLSQQGQHYDFDMIDSYNYPTYKYIYPTAWTFTYNLYVTNSITLTNHYDNVLQADINYFSTSLTGKTVVLGPNVTLVLSNGLSGAENITFNYTDTIDPGLTIYAGGTSASISGNQYINPSGFAGSLLIYCAPSVTSFTLNGNGQFTGVLVAPNADLAMNGGGSSDENFCGSLMVNNIRLNGHFSFHWDEALANMKSNNDARYLVQTWNEIP